MEARLIGPKEFGKLLGVCQHTAAAHMRNHPRCINIGLCGKEYLRLPLDAAEEILTGARALSPISNKPQQTPQMPKKRGKTKMYTGPQYVARR